MAKFTKGQSGNPAGRPKGIIDTRAKHRELLAPHAEELVKKAVDLALDGDTTALRLCLERIVPALKAQDQPVPVALKSGSLTEMGSDVIDAMADGKIATTEASSVLQALANQARLTEIEDLESRIRALEKASDEKESRASN